MANAGVFAILLLTVASPGYTQLEELATALEVVKLVRAIGVEVAKTWKVLADEGADVGAFAPGTSSKEDRLLAHVERLGKHVDDAAKQTEVAVASVLAAQRSLPTLLRYELRLDSLSELAHHVDALYRTLTGYTAEKARHKLERHTLEDFAQNAVSHGHGSIRRLLDQVHTALLGSRSARLNNGRTTTGLDRGVLALMKQAIQESGTNICALEQSPQQLIYSLYNLVALTELKGYAMMQFSWMILRQYEKGNFTAEADLMKQRTEQRALEKAMAAREAMASASRIVWRCDPKKYEENSTYVQLTELLQGHVQNEVDLNPQSSCRETCGYYSYAKTHGCYHNQYCSKQRKCNGRLFHCQYIDSDSWICPSNDPNRRYDWIEYENGRVLGKRDSCAKGSTKVDSWWRWLFWHCSYCFCVCDEQGVNSDRYFSLRPVIADVSAGKVVTGLRFIKMKRVVHIQIQEGKVQPRGTIDESSIRWRPVDSFRVENAAPGVDYHTMTYEQRAMDLDDLQAPEGYVLTGIRFRRIGTHINPEILATPLDMETGGLRHEGSLWLGNDNTDAAISAPRTELKVRSPDIPTRSSMPSEPDSMTDQYVFFTHSDINKDAAQTTIPFLDAQAVAPSPPILLSGAGIYHKGQSGYGGFIAIRVMTYDFSNNLGFSINSTTEALLPEIEAPNVV